MLRRISYLIAIIGLTSTFTSAYAQMTTPNEKDMYCSGVATTQRVSQDAYVVSGQESENVTVFALNDYVFINRGANQGVHVGDQYQVTRPVSEQNGVEWFDWQNKLAKAMGTLYEDEGRLQVVSVQPSISIARIAFACNYIQRGDIVEPFVARTAPAYKPAAANFDEFAPADGKAKGTVVISKRFGELSGKNGVVYVNLGSGEGVKVGDYFRIFRYQGEHSETAYEAKGMAYQLYGFGSAPVAYSGTELPRDVLGEGIVLRVGPNSATVLITLSTREIHPGDYVELE